MPRIREANYLESGEQPGASRERQGFRADSFPVIARDALASANAEGRRYFPFESWAVACRFTYPAAALGFLRATESAAEAYFLREFAQREGVTFDDNERATARRGTVAVDRQVRCALYRLDAVVTDGAFRLAIEIDGLGFHMVRANQVAADYLRERRVVAAGYTVIRFTAQEVFADAAECWRQIDSILAARRSPAPV